MIRLFVCLFFIVASSAAPVVAQSKTLQETFESVDPVRIAKEARLRGDPQRGAIVFHASAAACAKCHMTGEKQSPLGPDLADLGDKITDVHLVESLLYPSKSIRDGFQTVHLVTVDGKARSGMMVSENDDQIVLRDAANLQSNIVIAKDDIDARSNSKISMMPDGLVSTLKSPREFLDLLSYLFAIGEGGRERAEALMPAADELVPVDDTMNLDHAKIIRTTGKKNLKRGKQIYEASCYQCHGKDGNTPALATARAFGTQKLKFGSDPHSMFQTLSKGNGLMAAASALSPRERYEVIAYIRETFMKGSNPDYQPVTPKYLNSLPKGTEMGDAKLDPDRDFGPALASQLGRDVNSALSVKLGDLTIAYNLHTMNQAQVWSGGFLNVDATQHKRGRGEGYPEPQGKLIKSLDLWQWGHDGSLDYSTKNVLPRGPLPEKWLQYHGHYLHGDQIVLNYSVDGREILEVPSATDDPMAIRQTLTIHGGKPLLLAVGRSLPDRARPIVQGDTDGVTLTVDEKQRWVIQIPAGDSARVLDIVRFGDASAASDNVVLSKIDPTIMTAGGDLRWPETLTTTGYTGFESGAYAVDTITLPESTPWNTWFRTSAIDFFPDGRIAVATVGGDVWIASGINDDLLNIRWKRFAGGMFEPFGIKVVDGLIYVNGRDRLTRLHDINDDGEADFYESFSADTDVSTFFHAFNFDLQTDADGNFYYAKSGQYTDYKLPGSIVKVSADGTNREIICTGLRTPNGMGILPNGRLTVSDNQGTWMPASKINLVKQDGFYGYVQNKGGGAWAPDGGKINHRKVVPPYTFDPPLIWMPQEVDNSSGGQVFVDDERFGPLAGRLLHTSFGQGSLFYLMTQEIDGQSQAALARFPHDFGTGIMRGRTNPVDGQLYVTGLNGWNDNGRGNLADGGVYRVRYTGKPIRMITDCKVYPGKLQIKFNFPLDPDALEERNSYAATQWNYQWTGNYGSDHYHPQTGEVGEQSLPIESATLSEDGKTLSLNTPDLRPVDQLHLQLDVMDANGKTFNEDIYWTIHGIPQP
jgi:putative heme-binding domain-containing protein